MIYLVEDRDYIKIGFTSDLKSRESAYKTTNCYAKFVDGKPGTKEDETQLHILCDKGKYEREGFYNVPEVKEIGNNYQSKLLQQLLEVKSKIKEVFILLCDDVSIPNTKGNEILVSYTYSYGNGLFKIVEETKDTAQYEEIKTLYDELLAFRKLEQCYRFDGHSNGHYVFYDKYEVNYTIVQREENGERINKYTLTINEIVSSQ